MKDVKSIVIALLVIYIGYNFFFGTGEPVIKDEEVIIPEKIGKVEKKLDSIIRDTVYLEVKVPGKRLPARKQIVVDSTYKARYEKAVEEKDSLLVKNLFLESIAINNYSEVLVDDKNIRIDGRVTTRGTLLDYDVSYTIKADTITYTPKIYTKYPNLSLVLGFDVSPPLTGAFVPENNPMIINGHIGFQNKKGHIFTVGHGTDGRWTFGYKKSFKLSRR